MTCVAYRVRVYPIGYTDLGATADDTERMPNEPTALAIRLGKRIRKLRQTRQWQQVDLAAHAELSRGYISDVECARTEVCLTALERLAEALELSPADLLR